MAKLPLKVRYSFAVADEAEPRYAHGVWGGVNPHGEIEMNFYTEADVLPESAVRTVAEDGSISPESPVHLGEEDEKHIERLVHSRLILSPRTARAVLAWLSSKVQTLDLNEQSGRTGPQGSSTPGAPSTPGDPGDHGGFTPPTQ